MKILGVHRVPGEDQVSESRCKALNLVLNGIGHVPSRACGNVAVTPGRVLPVRSAARIEVRLLGEEHERTVGVSPGLHCVFQGGHLLEGSSEMHRSGPAAQFIGP